MKAELIGYYVMVALRGMRERWIVSSLMVLTLAVGIGGATAAYALIRAASANPVPEISSQLHFPVLETGPMRARGPRPTALWSYQDFLALSHAGLVGARVSANYTINPVVSLPSVQDRPRRVLGQAISRAFFGIVNAQFKYGGAWDADGAASGRTAVISDVLNRRLFDGADSVGRILSLDGQSFRVVGVLKDFDPTPKFYSLDGGAFLGRDDVFMDLETAIDVGMASVGNVRCREAIDAGMKALAASRCEWVSVISRGDEAAAKSLASWMSNYAAYRTQQTPGADPARGAAYDLGQWMSLQGAVPDDAIQLQIVCLGILSVSCANLVALLLSSFLRKEKDLGVRRALGAKRGDIAMQLLIESAVVGVVAGMVGTVFAAAGTAVMRTYVPAALARHVTVDTGLLVLAIVAGCLAAIFSGVYPAFRAATVNPAWQVKTS